jgi:hypothetical protein
MAINIPILTEFSDKGLQSAKGAFDTFRGKVAEAEGGMGKFKAGANVALDTVKANAGLFLATAGASIATFAYNAIKDFQDLALNVDEFRNITQLTLDQSSQWVSYTGDLGIEADAITKIFGRLAKAATDEIPAFEELGVAIAFGPDGSTDIEETFLRVNDAINALDDPVAEAAYRADLFGRGWMSASEIIQMSSDDIRTALEGVKDFEVIDEEEIQKAKDLREAQDELGDAFAEIAVELGEKLIPVLTDATNLFIKLFEFAEKFSNSKQLSAYDFLAYESWEAAVKFIKETDGNLDEFVDTLIDANDEMAKKIPEEYFRDRTWREGYRALIDAAGAAEILAEDLVDVDDALAELKGNIDERQAWRNLIDDIEEAGDKAKEAFEEATPQALRASEQALDNARLKVGNYVAEMDTIPPDKKTEIIASLDNANLAEVEQILNNLARARQIPFMPSLPPGVGGINEIGSGGREIGLPPINYNLLSGVGARSAVTVNVAGSVVTQNDLVESVRKGLVNSQRNGAGLVYSNR